VLFFLPFFGLSSSNVSSPAAALFFFLDCSKDKNRTD
jgi:hypothetical protein